MNVERPPSNLERRTERERRTIRAFFDLSRPFTLVAPALGFLSGAATAFVIYFGLQALQTSAAAGLGLWTLMTVGAVLRAGYFLLRKRAAAAKQTANRLAVFIAIYAVTLVLVSLVTPQKKLRAGEPQPQKRSSGTSFSPSPTPTNSRGARASSAAAAAMPEALSTPAGRAIASAWFSATRQPSPAAAAASRSSRSWPRTEQTMTRPRRSGSTGRQGKGQAPLPLVASDAPLTHLIQ